MRPRRTHTRPKVRLPALLTVAPLFCERRTSTLERIAIGEFVRPLAATEAAALGALIVGEAPSQSVVIDAAFSIFIHSLPSGIVEYAQRHLDLGS